MRVLRQHGDARVHHDEREAAFLLRLLHPPIDDGVLLRQIGAPCDQTVCVLEVLIAAGRAIGAKAALVAGYGGRHAQGGVAVVVVGADQAAVQLAQGVELLAEQLAGGDDGEGIAAVLGLDTLDFIVQLVQRVIPGRGSPFVVPVIAQQRLDTASCRSEQLMFEDPLQAQLAPIDVSIGHAARGDRLAVCVQADLNGAAGGTVAAGGIFPFHHALVDDLDRVLLAASEQHGPIP